MLYSTTLTSEIPVMNNLKKSPIKYLLITIAFSLPSMALAQGKFSAGLVATPSASTFMISGSSSTYEYIFPLSFGARVKYQLGDFTISSGVMQLSQGYQFDVDETTISNPQGTGNTYQHRYKSKAIAVPINVDYEVASIGKTSIIGGFGLYLGHIYSYTHQTNDPLYNRTDYVVQYEPFFLGLNAGAGMSYRLNQKFSFEARPNIIFQLPTDHSSEYKTGARQLTYGLDLGIYYHF